MMGRVADLRGARAILRHSPDLQKVLEQSNDARPGIGLKHNNPLYPILVLPKKYVLPDLEICWVPSHNHYFPVENQRSQFSPSVLCLGSRTK